MITREYDIFPRIRTILTFALLCCILCGCGKEAFSKNDPGPNMSNQSMTEQDTITDSSSTAETDNNSLPKQDEPLSVLNPGKHFRLRYIANHPIDVSYDAKALSSGVLLGGLSEKDGKLQFGSYHYTLDGRSGSSGPVEERFAVSDYCCYVDEEGGTLQILLLTETKADNSLAYFLQMGAITLDLSPWPNAGTTHGDSRPALAAMIMTEDATTEKHTAGAPCGAYIETPCKFEPCRARCLFIKVSGDPACHLSIDLII